MGKPTSAKKPARTQSRKPLAASVKTDRATLTVTVRQTREA